MSSPLALITGGAGFIGGHLSHYLLKRNYRVRILDSLLPQVHGKGMRFPRYLDVEVECLLADVRDKNTVSRALDGVDIVFHLAALTGVGQSMYQVHAYTEVNVCGTAVLLQCLIDRRQALKRLVLASSRSVYGEGKYRCASCGVVYPQGRTIEQLDTNAWEPVCPNCHGTVELMPTDEGSKLQPNSVYAITKRAQEELLLTVGPAYGLPVTVLRFFNVYGPNQSPSNPYTGLLITFLSRLMSGQRLDLYEDGQMLRDFVSVHDAVSASVEAAERRETIGQVINVGSGAGITVEQTAQLLIDLNGGAGSMARVGIARVGDIRHMVADTDRAERLLDYRPGVTLRDGVAELLAWFQMQETSAESIDLARLELENHHLLH